MNNSESLTTTWREMALGKVATLQRGYDLPSRLRRSGDIPVVTSTGVTDTHSEAKEQAPGVVTGRYGTIGQVFYVEEDYWPHNTTLFIKDFHGNDPLFVSYLLRTIDFNSHSGKSGVPGVNRNDLHELSVKVPSLPEQRSIATALSDMDELLGGLDRLITKKRDLKQAAMQQLLTGKTRLPGFDREWEVKRLGDVLTICHGRSQHEVQVEDGPYPILATGGQIGRSRSFLYDKPSVLIGRKGTIDQPKYMDTPFWTVDTLFYSIIRDFNYANFIFYRFCLIDWYKYNEASGVPSLNARTIESIEINFPPLPEQTAIATILSDMDAEIAAIEQRRNKTRDLKQAMMQELLTGRIRLKIEA